MKIDFFTPRSLMIALFALVLAVALTLGIINVARAQSSVTVLPNSSQQIGITVCGHGKANTHPDQANIEVGVQATSYSAQDARTQAAQAMNAVLNALKNQGIASTDIQTDYFAIQPNYNYNGSSSQITGYTVSNNASVTIHTVDKTGAIVDAVTQAGGNHVVISGIQFSTGDPSQTLAQAQQNALADAHQQAEQAAQAAGASLGAPLSIQLTGCGIVTAQQSYYSNNADSGTAATNTPIQPGQVEVSAYVQVVYALR